MSRNSQPPQAVVWVLEDESGLQLFYEELLSRSYDLRILAGLTELRQALAEGSRPDLLIADLNLCGASFLDLLKVERGGALEKVPFMVASSSSDPQVVDECAGFGAIGYLVKPFAADDLMMKMQRALLGRQTRRATNELSLDWQSTRVARGTQVVRLTSREFQILETLHEASGWTVTRAGIIDRIWHAIGPNSRSFDVHLHHLRRKIKPLGLEIKHRRPFEYRLTMV